MHAFDVLSRKEGGTGPANQFFSPAGRQDGHAFIQPKLTINNPDDAYEREADAMADKVMRMENPGIQLKPLPVTSVQRKCAHCEEEEKLAQRKEINGANTTAGNALESYIGNLNGGGQSLPGEVRSFYEPRFGYDFSNVRVHTDQVAAKSAQSINALAYTSGNNIVFNSGQYSPDTEGGKRLLGHELTHVIQQGAAGLGIQRAAIYTGNILDEGTCEHLACNSRWACEDPAGVLCPEGTRNAGTRRRPLFTCDANCDNGRTCSDNGNWMAIPFSRFARRKCGQDLVICSNNSFTHASVRDRSEGEHWEVSRGIQDTLGVPHGTFRGAVYTDEQDPGFLADSRCR